MSKNQTIRILLGLRCHPVVGSMDNSRTSAGPMAITHMQLT